MPIKTETQFNRESAQRRLLTAAADLNQLAEKYRRFAADLDRVPSAGRATHIDVAKEAITEHAFWLSNAHLESALQYAAYADVAYATEQLTAAAAGDPGRD